MGQVTNGSQGMAAIKRMQSNVAGNLNFASKACPIISECRDMSQGIARGDFAQVGANVGLLGLYASTCGGGSAGGKLA